MKNFIHDISHLSKVQSPGVFVINEPFKRIRSICLQRILPVILFGLNAQFSYSQLYINEILASNITVNRDPQYVNYGDWIEIYNAGSTAVNLLNYSISDDITNLRK